MSRVKALITPSVMRWARERAGLSLEDAAYKIKRPVGEITAWENGSLLPSIAQARKASEVYHRPLAVFYLPEPPKDFETLRDFRWLPATQPRDFSPQLALLIRVTQYQQGWMREFLLKEGFKPLPFIGSTTVNDSPRGVALDILRVLNLSPEEQRECNTRQEAFRLWMQRAEMAGVFVFRQRHIALTEARGIAFSDDIAPFVFVNSGDSRAAQLFTLAHELAHLWLDLSGVSNLEPYGRALDTQTSGIEVFCNKVAANAVLEEQIFQQEWSNQNPDWSIEDKIQHISGALKVSEEVVARRLLERNIIPRELYQELRQSYQDRWEEFELRERQKMKSSKGGPSYYVTSVARNGYAFSQTVIGAFLAGDVSGRDASSLLDVKVNNLRRLGEAAGMFASV
jgi:Zn-dependent peptidase ImmA (M78 family)/transcriptional regulator with XRE-family HTH domain